MNKRISLTDAGLLALVCLLYISLALYISYPHDDAFITFRYSRNLADGFGLVYNPGMERVEGYTNFLWMILIAPSFPVGIPPIVTARVLGMSAGIGIILTAFFFARKLFEGNRVIPYLVALGLATNFSLASWAVTGLETNMFSFFIFLGAVLYFHERDGMRPGWLWGVAFGFAALTRPEGWGIPSVLWGFEIFWLIFLARYAEEESPSMPWRLLIKGSAVFALIFVPYFIWRYNYFGFPLPNAFYAKVGITPWTVMRGFRYTGSFINRYNLFFLLFIPSVYLWKNLLKDRVVVYVAWFFIFWASYATSVGGDHMSFYRFLIPAVPFAVIWCAKAVHPILKERGNFWRGAALAVIFLLWCLPWLNPRIYKDIEWNRRHMPTWIVAGKALDKYAKPGQVLAVTTAGMIPFYSDLETIDMFGLNDVHIAHVPVTRMGDGTAGHEKGDPQYVMSKKPDYYVFFPWVTKKPQTSFEAGIRWAMADFSKDIVKTREFRENYKIVSIPTEDGRYFNVYERKKDADK